MSQDEKDLTRGRLMREIDETTEQHALTDSRLRQLGRRLVEIGTALDPPRDRITNSSDELVTRLLSPEIADLIHASRIQELLAERKQLADRIANCKDELEGMRKRPLL